MTIAAACLAALAGCQLSLPGGGGNKPAPVDASPITGDAITTTRLTATAPVQTQAAPPASPATTGPAAAAAPATAAKSPLPATSPETAKPAATAEGGAKPATDTTAAARVEQPVAPPVIKSPAQLACEKGGGHWSAIGKGNAARSCVRMTRDSAKRCTRKSDCEGQCLARSNTCAPVTPLFGCNEVLENSGARVTECIN